MTHPLAHKIDMRHKYTSADNTDIRILFERVRNTANSNKTVLAKSTVPDGTATGKIEGISTAECH